MSTPGMPHTRVRLLCDYSMLWRGCVLACVLVCVLVGSLVVAGRAVASPWWRLSSRAAPTNLVPAGKGLIIVGANDLGDAGISGAKSPVVVKDLLPQGLVVVGGGAAVHAHRSFETVGEAANWSCSLDGAREVSCETSLTIPPYEGLELEIPVEVTDPSGTLTTLENMLSVSGGETENDEPVPGLSISEPLEISEEPVSFGLEEDGYALTPEEEGGTLDTQAGSHPFQLTATVNLNQTLQSSPVTEPAAPALPRDLSFSLPPGLLGNLKAAAQCSEADFSALSGKFTNLCPAASAVGVATVSVNIPVPDFGYVTHAVPLFNLVPAHGEPARFAFEIFKVPVYLDTTVRTSGDYGVSVTVSNASQAAQLLGSKVTFWGVPSDPRHDASRGWACLLAGDYAQEGETCETPATRSLTPFLTLPTSCTGPLYTLMRGDSWTGQQLESGYVALQNAEGGTLEGLTGCQALPFSPATSVQPVQPAEENHSEEPTSAASTPTGLNLDVKVPQQTTLQAEGLGEADIKTTIVSLPEGLSLNPAAANGLQACSEAQVGYLENGGVDPFAPGAAEPARFSNEPVACPQSSKLGIVHIKTPLLNQELEGAVYLAAQDANPFGSLLALYIVAENPALGLRVKLAGETQLNEQTGQITTNFQDTPQVPIEELKLQLFGGAHAPLSTPASCGNYTTTSTFTAWSNTSSQSPSQPFPITTGTNGTPCPPSPLAFTPGFQAGVNNLQAGAFTPFTLTITHPDPDQPLQGLTVHLPAGVAALLSTVTPCPEPPTGQEWACGPQSLIGHSTASAGLGGEPYELPGSVYLTTGYNNAPFGVLVITPAVAGPFNLGDVDVRSKINVNPNTAAVTITSDPFPTFVKGIPVALKQINVSVDRPGFEFNPTSCTPTSITATLTGAQGASEPVSSPYQVANCQGLPFTPKLTATAAGHGSKANGTSLQVTVTSGGMNSTGVAQAGIAKVDLQLPKALSSRLSTLQKACTETTFNTNPASCGEDSVIGNATIHTPVLKNPLTGPAYLVSHGAEFPDVEFVLQGEGITLLLDGKTNIKHGITYSKFESTPDAPFTTFQTTLPAGPHSVLTPNVPEKENFNLCKTSLQMPTEITSQNGTTIKTTTNIPTTNCHTPHKPTKTQQLTKALKTCKHNKNKHKRHTCEQHAHKKYPTKTTKNK
jgi:hypothetical protein